MNEHAKNVREVAVLRNGPDQSILIPKEFEFSSDTVLMTQDANGTIHIRSKEPKAPRKSMAELIEWLKQQEPIEEEFEEIERLPPRSVDLDWKD